MPVELGHLEAFLTLFEERHFGRTGERLYVSGARVSQRIQELEREIGAPLFDRTSRRVTPTAFGEQLHDLLADPFRKTLAAVDTVRSAARSPRRVVRLGFTATTGGAVLRSLVARFADLHPEIQVELTEVSFTDVYSSLRDGRVDVVAGWQVHPAPGDLVHGPVLSHEPRVLMMSGDHPLAGRESVTTEDMADYLVNDYGVELDPALRSAITPDTSTSGRPIDRHPKRPATVAEALVMVADGVVVHPTVASMGYLAGADSLTHVPITDLPPLELGLIALADSDDRDVIDLFAAADPGQAPD